MYLCYKVADLTNELFRLKKERERKQTKGNENTSIEIEPRREYFEHAKPLALTNELFRFFALIC